MLRQRFDDQDNVDRRPEVALCGGAAALIGYTMAHKARYRLLFSDPQLPSDASLKAATFGSFTAFSRIVAQCQRAEVLPGIDTVSLTGLIYAALHGAIDLEIGGRASGTKGLGSVEATTGLLFDLLKRSSSLAPAALDTVE